MKTTFFPNTLDLFGGFVAAVVDFSIARAFLIERGGRSICNSHLRPFEESGTKISRRLDNSVEECRYAESSGDSLLGEKF